MSVTASGPFQERRSDATGTALTPRRRAGVDALPLDDELVLFDTHTGGAFAANPTASAIWQLCDGTRGMDGIARELAERFRVSHATVVAGVRQFVDLALDAGLLDVRPRDHHP
ncbi:MAG TPA: PqqD family protein [Chloroflexota bacterium]|nr:PqqD family protein [Chloroflexota bacterium]